VRDAPRRRPALPRDGGRRRTRTAGRTHGLPLPLRRRPAGARGRLPHLHDVAHRGVPAHGPERGGAVAVPAARQAARTHGTAGGGVRPARRAAPGQPPAGLLPPGLHPRRETGAGDGLPARVTADDGLVVRVNADVGPTARTAAEAVPPARVAADAGPPARVGADAGQPTGAGADAALTQPLRERWIDRPAGYRCFEA